jgi:enamine deaminase RidA (YjgF/YER057c/UK114 family)
VRQQVSDGGPWWACRLVEIDDPLLRGDEHGHRGRELRHRCPRKLDVHVAGRRLDAAHDADRNVLARPRGDLRESLHGAETNGVDRQRISSGSAYEDRVGYSRAVRWGPHVWVAGTAPIMPDDADPPANAYEQARICIDIVARALGEAGGTLDQVVRTRIYVTDASLIDDVGRAHREAFGSARPATTGVVCGLLDPRWLVEIEVEAYLG